jgi:hypothetical protein
MSKASSPRRKNPLSNLPCYRYPQKNPGSRISQPETPESVFIGDLIRNIDAEIDSLRSVIMTILKYDPQDFQRLRLTFTRFTGLLYCKWFLDQINQGTSVAVPAAATIARFLDRVMPDRLDLSRMTCPDLAREIRSNSQQYFFPLAETIYGTVRSERPLWGS